MYAVIRSGGKQYRVEPGALVHLETLPGKVGEKVTFKEVLLVNDAGDVKLGNPTLAKAKVTATIIAHGKQKKVRVYKFKKNSQYKILRGHRQHYTAVKVEEISA